MGVDISTYRCRIGCFNGISGSSVLTKRVYSSSDDGLKTVGSMLFVGILLLIAGIESNPGPITGLQESTVLPETYKDTGYDDISRRLRNVFEEALKTLFRRREEERFQHLEIQQQNIRSERRFAEAGGDKLPFSYDRKNVQLKSDSIGKAPITRRQKVSKYDVPDSCYPRYQYTKKHAATIKDDYIELKRRILQNQKPVIDKNTQTGILLYVFEPFKKTVSLRPANLVLRAHETCRTQQMSTHFGKELSQLYSVCPADSTVVAIERFGVEEQEPAASLLLLAEDKDDMAGFENNIASGIQVCLKEKVNVKICEMLERDILRQMEKVYKDLDKVRCDIENQHKTGNLQKSIIMPCSCLSDKGCCKCFERTIEEIKRLQADITGLVKRSKVPEDQKPQLCTDIETKVDQMVIDALKETSQSIDHCGYNLDTLYIFVDEKHPDERLKMDIEKTMSELCISKFRIVSSHVNVYSTPVSGSEVVVNAMTEKGIKKATLTGFGRLTENNNLVAVISRHLAIKSIDKKLYIKNGSKYLTGDIMKELFEAQNESNDIIYERAGASNEHERPTQSVVYPKICIDMAFASISEKDEHACDTRYRTDENRLVKGRLCAFDRKQMIRLPVYIWGNATGLGRGIVSMSDIVPVNESDKHLLMIEDTKGKTFCKEGDSGAMVCADDPDNYGDKVQLISMVMGAVQGEKGKYQTVKIKEGLEYIAGEIGENIDMC
ncbi:uncharacterized protein LOC123541488 isoform X2 [Mercenaria mercenaria]|uniref:uncharacterized protein LOC123541488 isoform X2 n=1 Tax=Mercenaria mercenaria TaxID=6596 RepID=UPI00234F7F5F|nr:uncharacterized protein LOC123541488 isoform X2 [Mercenaria mercenaria]